MVFTFIAYTIQIFGLHMSENCSTFALEKEKRKSNYRH